VRVGVFVITVAVRVGVKLGVFVRVGVLVTPVGVKLGVFVRVGVKVGVIEVFVGVRVNVLVGTGVPPGSLPQTRVPLTYAGRVAQSVNAAGIVPVVCQKSFVPLKFEPQLARCNDVWNSQEFPTASEAVP
jgi:hypothetical protein